MGVRSSGSVVVMSDWSMKEMKNDDNRKAFKVSTGEGRDRVKTRPNDAILV